MFPSFLSRRPSKSSSKSPTDVDANEARRLCGSLEDEPDVRELNDTLRVLVDVFPDFEVQVFREMLIRVSPESRLAIVTERLLKDEAQYVKGRYRPGLRRQADLDGTKPVASKTTPLKEQQDGTAPNRPGIARVDEFRNLAYKNVVHKSLSEEFRSLSRSTINAVLAEMNYEYTASRIALTDVAAKSWRASMKNFLFRRKTPTATSHPFIKWHRSKDSGRNVPTLARKTGSVELDLELHARVIAPALEQEREAIQIIDRAMAHHVLDSEAREASEEYDCEVCYSSAFIHEMAVCNDGGHFICFRCITRTMNEAIYGQGWVRSIDSKRGTMKCVAPVLDSSGDCHGCIPLAILRRALSQDENSSDNLFDKFEQRFTTLSLQELELTTVNCPFCPYTEVDGLDLASQLSWEYRDPLKVWSLGCLALLILLVVSGLPVILLLLAAWPLSMSISPLQDWPPVRSYLLHLARKSQGLRFTCLSPRCGKQSCQQCHVQWRDPHKCFETQMATLQKAVEAAQTAAVKRICPRCHLAFVKASGCNKMICACGYKMCYLCRAEIVPSLLGGGGYEHFCQHFRVAGGRCTQCDKCDLYREEDEKEILRLAKEKAEREWREGEGRDTALAHREDLGTLVVTDPGASMTMLARLDSFVERIILVKAV